MHFERTFDYELVKKIATHPRVYPHASDDFAPPPEQWEPIKDELIWYVLAKDGEELLGMFALIPENAICWNIHVCLLPNSWGPRTREAFRGVCKWIFENSICMRIVGTVVEDNRLALHLALESGMKEFGRNLQSKMESGILKDQICVGVNKSWV